MPDKEESASKASASPTLQTTAVTTSPGNIQSSRSRVIPTISTKALSVLVTGIVMLSAIIKADKKDIPEMVKTMVGSSPFAVVGWVLAIVFLIGGIVFLVTLHKLHSGEVVRIAKERDKLQNKLLELTKKS